MISKYIIVLIQEIVKPFTGFEVFAPEKEIFGHYSTNVALLMAKIRKQSPLKIAQEIKENLEKTAPPDFFEKIEIAPPGFINFWLSPRILQNELKKILRQGHRYGAGARKKPKIQIEFISANPTGPLTLANGRGGFFGDILANILEYQGFKVEREYYVNDTGNQIIILGKSILAAIGLLPPEENFYKGAYIKKWGEENTAKIKKQKNNSLKIGQLAASDFLTDIKKIIRKTGIKFDRFTSEENQIRKKGLIDEALKILKEKKLVYKREGALWFKAASLGDDKDRVLITKDGFPTYFLADAGHYLETKKRGFSGKINILGPDHHGYVKRIKAAAAVLGLKGKSECLVTQAVRLNSGRMSKRKGEFITFEELIDEVGLDAARFFFLMYSPDTHMDFDLRLAKEKSLKNPVYYVQYAFVRCGSILRKFKIAGEKAKLNLLNTDEDLNLIRELIKFSEVIQDISENYQAHRLVKYVLGLAKKFNNFYEKERVVTENESLSQARLALVRAVKNTLAIILDLLGISKPEKM